MDHRSSAILRVGVMLVVFFLFGLGMASAQTNDCTTGPFLVLNLAGDNEIANKSIAFDKDRDDLRTLLTNPGTAFLTRFGELLKDGQGNNRWITKKGDTVAIYVVYDKNKTNVPTLDITEQSRKTQFASDLETLTKLFEKIEKNPNAEAAVPPAIDLGVIKQCRILTKLRATLEITAMGDPNNEKPQEQTAGKTSATATITTGPTEHAFLSADLAVNSVKQLKLESGQLVPKDNPSTFYVGFDYMLGDVLAETSTFPQGLTFKALIEASKDPTNSYGLALGMRFKNVKLPGISLDTFSPFAGYFWTRNDTLTGHKYKGDWRAGISLNLDKALNWVK
jgi:hypothetical protein